MLDCLELDSCELSGNELDCGGNEDATELDAAEAAEEDEPESGGGGHGQSEQSWFPHGT